MPVTLKQIAEECGVSRQTVGFILSGKKNHLFKEDTRKLVEDTANRLGYQANSAAQAMAGKRFNAIGFLCGQQEATSYIHHQLLEQMSYALKEHGMHMALAFLPDEQIMNERNRPKFLSHKMVDGLFLNYTHDAPDGIDEFLERSELPCVRLNAKQDFNAVYPDDYNAAKDNTDILMDAGYEKVIFFNFLSQPKGSEHYSCVDRMNGYTDAVRARGLEPIILNEYSEVLEHIKVHAEGNTPKTAYFAYNLIHALKVYGALEYYHISLPEDGIVATFNPGWLGDDELNTKIKVLEIPHKAMAHNSVNMLLEMVDGKAKNCKSICLKYSNIEL